MDKKGKTDCSTEVQKRALFEKKTRNKKRKVKQQISIRKLSDETKGTSKDRRQTEEETDPGEAEAQIRLKKYGLRAKGRKALGLLNETYVPRGLTAIRVRLRIMTLNASSFPGNKKLIECYLNDNHVHVAVLTVANVAKIKITDISMNTYSLSNHCCREEEGVKGGGGGAVIIFIHDGVPLIEGHVVGRKDEVEHCSSWVYPDYNYEQKLAVAGVYRPPKPRLPL